MNPVLQLLQYGTYYSQAWRHYGNPTTSVVCYCCRTRNLRACIGFRDIDLCMRCVAEQSELHFPDDAFDQQRARAPPPHTRGFSMRAWQIGGHTMKNYLQELERTTPHPPPAYPGPTALLAQEVHSTEPLPSGTS